MNKSLQSYTPRFRPMPYDALLQDTGCQEIFTSRTVYQLKRLEELCIFDHDTSSTSIFNRLDIVSYADGPTILGSPLPWNQRWAAWVADAGVRVGPYAFVGPPANGAGTVSELYPTTKPTRLSLGFTSEGWMAIAIQKTPTRIELKWFNDDLGLSTSIGTILFEGYDPVLFFNGILEAGDDSGDADLVLFYLREGFPKSLFARMERDLYLVEHEIITNVQVVIVSLVAAEKVGRKLLLYGRDSAGRDVTFYSEEYYILIDDDEASLTLSIQSGAHIDNSVLAAILDDGAQLALSIVSGIYGTPIVNPPTLAEDQASLALSIVEGEYTR